METKKLRQLQETLKQERDRAAELVRAAEAAAQQALDALKAIELTAEQKLEVIKAVGEQTKIENPSEDPEERLAQ